MTGGLNERRSSSFGQPTVSTDFHPSRGLRSLNLTVLAVGHLKTVALERQFSPCGLNASLKHCCAFSEHPGRPVGTHHQLWLRRHLNSDASRTGLYPRRLVGNWSGGDHPPEEDYAGSVEATESFGPFALRDLAFLLCLATPAFTKRVKSGCAKRGLDLNSGWN